MLLVQKYLPASIAVNAEVEPVIRVKNAMLPPLRVYTLLVQTLMRLKKLKKQNYWPVVANAVELPVQQDMHAMLPRILARIPPVQMSRATPHSLVSMKPETEGKLCRPALASVAHLPVLWENCALRRPALVQTNHVRRISHLVVQKTAVGK